MTPKIPSGTSVCLEKKRWVGHHLKWLKDNKMEAIKTLHEVISALTAEEKVTVRTYLGTFIPDAKNEQYKKGVLLFDLLSSMETHKLNIERIEQAVYKKPNKPALKKLANRIYTKVLDGLIIYVNVDRNGAYSQRSKATIDVRKQITQAQILHNRGKINFAKRMFDSIIQTCTAYELYEEQMIALRVLIRTRSLKEGDSHLSSLMKKYLKCEKAKKALMRAEIYFTQITAPQDFRASMKIDQQQLRNMLDEMRDDATSTGSSQISHYYFQLEAQNHQEAGDYLKARRELLNDLKLIQTQAALQSEGYLFSALANIADNDLYLGQFDRSFTKANEAMLQRKKGSHDYEISVEIMFYAKFFSGEFEFARNLLIRYIPSEEHSTNFRSGKRTYFLAATFFMLKDFTSAAKLLSIVNPIDSDKDGWALGIKFLQILNAIELYELDEASTRIEALRKYFASGKSENDHRAKMIHNILISLSYNGYNFKPIYQEQKTFFDLLGKPSQYQWRLKSPELIIFQQWFFAKVVRHDFVQEIRSFQSENQKTWRFVQSADT